MDKTAATSKDVCFKGPKGLLNKLFHLKPKVKAYNDVLAPWNELYTSQRDTFHKYILNTT